MSGERFTEKVAQPLKSLGSANSKYVNIVALVVVAGIGTVGIYLSVSVVVVVLLSRWKYEVQT